MFTASSPIHAQSLLAAEATGGSGGSLLMLLLMVFAIVFLLILPARRQKKMQAQLKERQENMKAGTEVMTNFGLYGKVVSVDQDKNLAYLEIAPGTEIRVHLQTVSTIIDEQEAKTADNSVPDTAEKDQ